MTDQRELMTAKALLYACWRLMGLLAECCSRGSGRVNHRIKQPMTSLQLWIGLLERPHISLEKKLEIIQKLPAIKDEVERLHADWRCGRLSPRDSA
jgi:hypothetical protein